MKAFKMKGLLTLLFIISIVLSACGNQETSGGTSEDFPDKPIKIIVPFAAGGAATHTARIIAQYSEEHMGQSIVIENREGGGGTAGQGYVASADADGYTLLLATTSVVTNPIFNKTSYTYEDYQPIMQLVSDVTIMYASSDAPYDDFDSFVEYAKQNPGEVTIATSGAQASDNIAGQEMIKALGIDATTIPYDGGAPAVASAAGGHDDIALASFSEGEGQVQSENLKPILVLGEKSHKEYPNIPTSVDKGFDVTDESWRGLVAPAGTDPEVIEHLHEAFKKGFENEEYQEKMENMGMVTRARGPEEFKKLMDKDFERMSKLK
ncbi:tripartite tricarboxylate transporter substrate binding protein [Pontibacillus marinus]|uniref:Tripartite tricarboxylate transporter substrate binding protein n=1 Tax=Pontibacillus marinus BH030004 = DSM 16465 TaxID=1385511 RepID=A0A0A5I3X4_9BACI|nr:tripartite tricarboxylate transporter substrate binding protein [Pontibacillus marinus]KGX90497.1 hypothetical protein N783_16725 [Pontibacillus marinus BH030004 = DSM 16465]